MSESDPTPEAESQKKSEFEEAAETEKGGNVVSEFFAFLGENKKWWLAPIVIVMLLLGVLIILTSTPAAPFIYSLF